jgi:hypothetical protein
MPVAFGMEKLHWEAAPEEAAEMEEEYAYELGLLEELLKEFEGELNAILQDPHQGMGDVIGFWKETWAKRMREVVDGLEGDRLAEDERWRAEEIGVVWDRPRPPTVRANSNPYSKKYIEHWLYELEKIEAECQ